MTRNTLLLAKNARIPEAINISSTDSRFLQYLNQATERLLWRGKFWNTYARYVVTVSSQFFTLPPYIETLERFSVNKVPMPIHDDWYQFLDTGWGPRDDTLSIGSGINEALYRGNFPTAVDVPSPGGTVTVKCDRSTDVGKPVLILGRDINNNWVRTTQAGVIADGEVVLLAQGAGNTSATQWAPAGIVAIQPPHNTDGSSSLDGQWWLYFGGVTGTLLSRYEYWETSPSYKRYLVPGPASNAGTVTVEVMGKKAFYPVKNDTDYLVVGNLAALKLACMAILAEDDHNWGEANLLWNGGRDKKTGVTIIGAVQELDLELQHQLGDGREIGMQIRGSNIGEIVPVEALI